MEENPRGRRVCRFVRVHVWMSALHWVIAYNHPKCLYCTNSITVLREWLCGDGVAEAVNEPGRSLITQAHGQALIVMQRDRRPAISLYEHHIHTALCHKVS